jgi:hypothetical protein
MNYRFLWIWCVVCISYSMANTPYDFLIASDSNKVFLFVTEPPPESQSMYLQRRIAGEPAWQTIQSHQTTTRFTPNVLRKVFGTKFPKVLQDLQARDELEVWHKMKQQSFHSSFLAILNRELAIMFGRLYIDSTAQLGQSYEYRGFFTSLQNDTVFTKEVSHIHTALYADTTLAVKAWAADQIPFIQFAYGNYESHPFRKQVMGFHIYKKTAINEVQLTDGLILRNENDSVLWDGQPEPYGTEQWYQVRGWTFYGAEYAISPWIPLQFKDHKAPRMVRGIQLDSVANSILLQWDPAPEADFAYYTIYKAHKEGALQPLDTILDKSRRSFLDTNARSGKNSYVVTATDSSGNESVRHEPYFLLLSDKTPPDTVSITRITLQDENTIRLQWTPAQDSGFAGSHVLQKHDFSDAYFVVSDSVLPQNVTWYDYGKKIGGLQPGRLYTFAIKVWDHSQNTSLSAPVSIVIPDTTPPAPPARVQYTISPSAIISLQWDRSVSRDVKHYIVDSAGVVLDTTVMNQWQGSPQAFGSTVEYGVLAVDSFGNQSKPTQIKVFSRTKERPPYPRNFYMEPVSEGTFFQWTFVPTGDIAYYLLYHSSNGMGNWNQVKQVAASQNAVVLQAAKGYYQIRAKNTSGNESKNNETIYVD